MKYYVSYGTTTRGSIVNVSTIDEAKQLADDRVSYTQMDISIFEIKNWEAYPNEDSKLCCERKWWGLPFDNEIADDVDIIDFGDFGYYADWE